jgi:hypothetical protein
MEKIKEFQNDRIITTYQMFSFVGNVFIMLVLTLLCIGANLIRQLLYIVFLMLDFIFAKKETIQYWIMFVPTLLGIGYAAIDPPAIILRTKEQLFRLLFSKEEGSFLCRKFCEAKFPAAPLICYNLHYENKNHKTYSQKII